MGGLLTSLFTGQSPFAGTPEPTDGFWYGDPGQASQAGPRITDEVALTLSAVYACVDKHAKAFEIAPCHLNETLSEDAEGRPRGIRRATDHWLYSLLHDQPNARQTAPEFWAMSRAHLALRGAFYARKVFGRGDEILALEPFHPDHVDVKILPSGRRGFSVARPGGGSREPLTQDEVFCVIGLSLDGGKTGVSVIKYAKETLGLARATEDYAAKTFSNGALHRGVVRHPGKLSSKAAKNLLDSIVERTAGPANWQRPLILEEGAEWKEMSMTPEDTQLLLSRRFSIADVARWFDVPLVMIHETDRTTSWGTGIESLMIGFVTWGVLPPARRTEAAIYRDLVPEQDKPGLRAKFNLNALLRADTQTRFAAHAIGIQNGFESENEVRMAEDLNPVPGLWEPRRSANQDRGGDPQAARPSPPAPAGAPDDEPPPRPPRQRAEAAGYDPAEALAESNARGVVRTEIAAIKTLLDKRSGEDLTRGVAEYYGRHTEVLMGRLCLTQEEARRYGADHCAAVLARGAEVLEEWERDAPVTLVALALRRGG